MKYYLIVGEASGDLHASHLMTELKRQDPQAEFRFFGGDLMLEACMGNPEAVCMGKPEAACMGKPEATVASGFAAGIRVRHYKDLAYMGFIPVLLHLRTILKNMAFCKRDIVAWNPDAVILVDYPGFNLDIAKFLKAKTSIPAYYYISPKIWAWKEHRIKNIKRNIAALFSILPFEVDFFEKKHGYKIHYVGNPTAQEVREFLERLGIPESRNPEIPESRPILALLSGSRRQEIRDNLPKMLSAALSEAPDHEIIIAGAPGIEPEYYEQFIAGKPVKIVFGKTYELLSKAHAALVTSGTATLETALFRVPQVVCYETGLHFIIGLLRKTFLKVPFVSLVNLIGGREIVPELIANDYTLENIRKHLRPLLAETPERQAQLAGYEEVACALGTKNAPEETARLIIKKTKNLR